MTMTPMMIKSVAFLLLLLLCPTVVVASDSVVLHPTNYESLTEGKVVFIKLYAPWCGHCKTLAPDWEKMAQGLKDDVVVSNTILVGEVDCTDGANEDWCMDDFDIQGFPTILYGDPTLYGDSMEEYAGNRDAASMIAFAKKELTKPMCNAFHSEGCNEEQGKLLDSLLKMSLAEVESLIEEKEDAIEKLEDELEAGLDRLQSVYDEAADKHQSAVSSISNTVRLMVEVAESRGFALSGLDDDDEEEEDDDDNDNEKDEL